MDAILNELLGSHGKNVWITAPFFVDYGENIHLGNNVEINMNCVFLDCNRITTVIIVVLLRECIFILSSSGKSMERLSENSAFTGIL